MRKLFLVLTIFIPLAFGQADSNSITVTASRNIAPGQPDQAVFSVQVNSSLDATLDDVIMALQGSGITVANFSGLNSFVLFTGTGPGPPTPLPPLLDWSFRIAVPFAKTKDTVSMLTALQQTVRKKNNGITISFVIQGTQTSAPSQQTCSLSDLVADARARAEKVADAGGVSVGNILAMSSAAPNTGAGLQVASLGNLPVPVASPLFCALTVKFALVRF